MLTEEQAQQMKSNIIQQINSTFPEDKRQAAIQQVETMNVEELEQFIEQNTKTQGSQNPGGGGGECIFCSIVSKKIPSYKIDENKGMIATLEINPISKGHTLIIPKKHSNKTSKRAISFSEKISEKIKSKLKPKNVITSTGNLFGHEIINIIPVYQNENQNSQRYKAEEDELLEVQKIMTKKKVIKPRTKKVKDSKLWLPKRIP